MSLNLLPFEVAEIKRRTVWKTLRAFVEVFVLAFFFSTVILIVMAHTR